MATTSQSEPAQTRTAADRPQASPELTEAQFLAAQAEQAKAAMLKTVAELKSRLAEGANPAQWTRDYPWISLGVGAVAGFVAASTLIPSKEEQALRRLARIEAALNVHREPAHNGSDKGGAPAKEGGGLIGKILKEILAAIGPMLANLISTKMANTTPDTTPDGDATAGGVDNPAGAPSTGT
jgi:hypothetical protein